MVDTFPTLGGGSFVFEFPQGRTYRIVVDETTLPTNLVRTFDAEGPLDGRALVVLEDVDQLDVDFGYTTGPAPAPAASEGALLVAILTLIVIGGTALFRRASPVDVP